jgi:hypothetical protein
MLRFHHGHARDDYRLAARIAEATLGTGHTVWWAASDVPAIYYGLPLCDDGRPNESPCAWLVANATARELDALPRPTQIITSKPDLFDRKGAVRAYIVDRGYVSASARPHAFSIYERDMSRSGKDDSSARTGPSDHGRNRLDQDVEVQ